MLTLDEVEIGERPAPAAVPVAALTRAAVAEALPPGLFMSGRCRAAMWLAGHASAPWPGVQLAL